MSEQEGAMDWQAAAAAAGWVPAARLSEVVQERNALREQVAEAKAARLEAEAAAKEAASKPAAEVEELRAKIAEMEQASTWTANEVELAKRGLHDPELVDYVRYRWGQVEPGEDGTRPAFGEWLEAQAESSAILRSVSATKDAPRKPAASVRETGARGVKPDSAMSLEALSQMSHEDYRANREALTKQLGAVKLQG